MAGKYFEQFEVGQTFVHEIRRTVTDMDNILFSALTYNPAAIHIDHEYAKTTEFGRPLINSIFTLGLIVGLSVQDTTLGTTVGNLGFEEVTFPKPCSQTTPSGRKPRCSPCARASRGRPKASSRSNTAASTNATKSLRPAGASRSCCGSRSERAPSPLRGKMDP